MRSFLRSFVCILFFLVTCILTPRTVHASDFTVDYDVSYRISDQGKTTVTQDISLVNKKTNLYAREYSIVIDSTKIKNVVASDSRGIIVPAVTIKDGKTDIHLIFNDEVVGLGKILHFTLKYEDENIAKKNGTIWEVSIPGIAEDQDLGDYSVRLSVPESFGPPAYLTPLPKENFRWEKDQLINGGVSGAFGKKQVVELTLSYFLENSKSVPVVTELALPPTSAFQRVTIESLDPKPQTIVADRDGNWLARYLLSPQSTQTVRAVLLVEIFLSPRPGYVEEIADETMWLARTQYWDTNNSTIQELASALKTPREIYEYVTRTLVYDYARVNQTISRKGAVEALADPKSAVCMEFTDLFVTLARSAGIPARQAVGYAYTTNPKLRPLSLVSDILHAWPEYYDRDQQLWIPVDPTWANTTGGIDYFDKLDFNHITFAFNGTDDSYPFPAGYYRQTGKTGKDVEVNFRSDPVQTDEANLSVTFSFPALITAGFETKGEVVISNSGNSAAEKTAIQVDSRVFGISTLIPSKSIPPFGEFAVPLSVRYGNYFQMGSGIITASVNGNTVNYRVEVTPAYHVLAPLAIGIIWISIFLVVIIRAVVARKKKLGKSV